MLLGSSTSRRTMWSQKPDARESPFVWPSGTIWKSLSLKRKNLKESVTQLHAAMPDLAQALPCSYSTDHANLMGYMSCKECSSFEIFDLYIPDASSSDIGKDTFDYESMITHAFKQPEPVSSATVMQWIITLIHATVIQCTWRRISRWIWWFELLTYR